MSNWPPTHFNWLFLILYFVLQVPGGLQEDANGYANVCT